MRRIALLALCLICASAARATGPDDDYLEIYSAILQADSLEQDGKFPLAVAKYFEAQAALQKLQAYHPAWNPDVVHFRLEYLTDQLRDLGKMAPLPASPNPPITTPVPAPADGTAERISALQEQVRALTLANGELGNKLKEALSIQPAALSPRQLANAEEKILSLEKERDLLKVNLEQARQGKSEPVPSGLSAALANAKSLLAEQDKQIGQLREKVAALEKNLVASKRQLSARMKELADTEAHGDAELLAARAALREAQKERDELARKWAVAKAGDDGARPVSPLPEPFRPVVPGNSPPATDPPGSSTTNAGSAHSAHSSKDLPPGAGALMADAMRASMERDYARAEEKYQEILRQDENNVYVLAHLAEAQFAAGKLDDCEKTVLKALKLDANDAASLYFLGILRYRQEKLDAALEALTRSAQFNPTNASTQTYLGCVLDEKGLHTDAEGALRKALELDPKSADAHYNLALVYASENPPSLALAQWHYDRAVALGHVKKPDFEKKLAPPKPSQ